MCHGSAHGGSTGGMAARLPAIQSSGSCPHSTTRPHGGTSPSGRYQSHVVPMSTQYWVPFQGRRIRGPTAGHLPCRSTGCTQYVHAICCQRLAVEDPFLRQACDRAGRRPRGRGIRGIQAGSRAVHFGNRLAHTGHQEPEAHCKHDRDRPGRGAKEAQHESISVCIRIAAACSRRPRLFPVNGMIGLPAQAQC